MTRKAPHMSVKLHELIHKTVVIKAKPLLHGMFITEADAEDVTGDKTIWEKT